MNTFNTSGTNLIAGNVFLSAATLTFWLKINL